jgi:hypothetical protein
MVSLGRGNPSVRQLQKCSGDLSQRWRYKVDHVDDVEGYIFGVRVLWGAKTHWQGYDHDRTNLFPTETIEELN